MDKSGIYSYRGFLYQTAIYILLSFKYVSNFCSMIYESYVDDIEKVDLVTFENTCYQIKSGTLTTLVTHKIIVNWLLVDNFENYSFCLICEKSKNSNLNSISFDAFYKSILSESKLRPNSNCGKLLKIYNKENLKTAFDKLMKKIIPSEIINDENIDNYLKDATDSYFGDFESLNAHRREFMCEKLFIEIAKSIAGCKSHSIDFREINRLSDEAKKQYPDEHPSVDVDKIINLNKEEKNELFSKCDPELMESLKKIFPSSKSNYSFYSAIAGELQYENLRNIYGSRYMEDIEKDERLCFAAYCETLDDFSITSPNQRYFALVNKSFSFSFLNSDLYTKKGCVCFLSSGNNKNAKTKILWND